MTQYVPERYYPPQPTWIQVIPVRRTSALAGWALGLGIAGLFLGWCTMALPCIAAVALGHLALTDTKDGTRGGRGMAVTGLVLGYVVLAPAAIFCVWYAATAMINLP